MASVEATADTAIWALEMMLERARLHNQAGRASYFIAILAADGEKSLGGWFGDPVMEKAAMDHLAELSVTMKKMVENKTLPWWPPTTPDRVCCNVAADTSPMSYDFVAWLVDKEMARIEAGAPAPLKVGFWFGRDGKAGLEHPDRNKMFHNVVRPMLALIGAVEDPDAIDGAWKAGSDFHGILKAARRGCEVPRFRAPANLVAEVKENFGGCVTITLRESHNFPYRNSNMDAWLKFAGYLTARGERVVFVRDTARVHDAIEGYETAPDASIDLNCRVALYEAAKINLFVSNGPATLAFFSHWPWMAFLGSNYEPDVPKVWNNAFGLKPGEQLPWSRRDQRIVWTTDTYENLVAAWEDMTSAYRTAAE